MSLSKMPEGLRPTQVSALPERAWVERQEELKGLSSRSKRIVAQPLDGTRSEIPRAQAAAIRRPLGTAANGQSAAFERGVLCRSSARHEPEEEGLLGNGSYSCFQSSHLSLIQWGKGASEFHALVNLLD